MTTNGEVKVGRGDTPFEKAALGFRNYWYPLCRAKDVGIRPSSIQIMGEKVAVMRRNGKPYAVLDECPHRGVPLSLGRYYFPGSDTISCRFHGFTFDLTNGACVAALADGPESPVVGKIRVRTFPLEERKGIVWIWMGRGAPVPIEEDVPNLLLRDSTIVKWRDRIIEGNWRYHAQADAGHYPTTHHDALALLSLSWHAHLPGYEPMVITDPVEGGAEWVIHTAKGMVEQDDYPGLGKWPPKRLWRRSQSRVGSNIPIQGSSHMGVRMPGVLRVPHWPMIGAFHYEWYVAVDEDHYRYVQVNAYFPSNPLTWLWTQLWHHLWADPMRNGRFNQQDAAMSKGATDFERKRGSHWPTPLFAPDRYGLAFIDLANRTARGEAAQPAEESLPAVAGGSGESRLDST